jgi:predicted DNA-binding protein
VVSGNGPEPRRRLPTSFWLDDETKNTLDRLTRELGMNRSAIVREAIRRMISDEESAEVRRLVAELERAVAGGGDSRKGEPNL